MKKTYHFGKIKAYQSGKKINAVDVSIELSGTQGEEEFTASGTVWNATKTDCIMGGQCLDELFQHDELKVNPTFKKIYRLWKAYHLNGMRPECEHQKALGWEKEASEKINLYHYRLNKTAEGKKEEAKKQVLEALKKCKPFTPTIEQSTMYNLPLFINTYEPNQSFDYEPYLDFMGTPLIEEEARGWVTYGEGEGKSIQGLLCKPCPVCGYKYGTAWKHHPIPADDLAEIVALIEGGE